MDRVTVNPDVAFGKPVIRGTRISVQLIVKLLANGVTEEEILSDYYPELVREDIKAALLYASESLGYEEVILV
ncbi:MAG: DUF433 domain-containing protein [Nitrososphaerota archaeon]|jgi:uncharacterized protein (DUF433 family)|nr:DUF433 domain-containing protein [Nitrososphaerota archaeon]